MLDILPPTLQVYLAAVALGVAAPLVTYGLLRAPLLHFLHAIFGHREVERFWQRVLVATLLCGSLSAAIQYRPDESVADDYVAVVFQLADYLHHVLQSLLWIMLAIFLPLLLAYTILHVGRPRPADPEALDPPPAK